MQIYIPKIIWLRCSGNPAAVCINICWPSTGADTQEIALFHAGICFESVLAQILGKSCSCVYEYVLTLHWLRYSGNPAAVCINILWHSTGSDTREILPAYAGIYSDTPLAQIHGESVFYDMQEYALKVCWLRYSGNPAAVLEDIFWKSFGSDTREILLLY